LRVRKGATSCIATLLQGEIEIARLVSYLLTTALVIASIAVSVQSQARDQRSTKGKAEASSGKQTFAVSCAACHGLDGRGGERGPNIAADTRIQRLSDAQLSRIVTNGFPRTGMPAFRSLGPSSIKSLVGYLRVLQGQHPIAGLPGNPVRGQDLFSGKAGCSECHAIAGVGGSQGPDLSAYAPTRSPEEIKDAILNAGDRDPRKIVNATSRDGQQYRGVVRNEDNFSLQLQTEDGTFHLLMKSELQKLERIPDSRMPSDYGKRLSPQELDDIVSYLMKAGEKADPKPASEDDK